jgi:hypothetical protein
MKFNFLRRSKRVIVDNKPKLELIVDVLTIEQRCVARVWYNLHKEYIDEMVAKVEKTYFPSSFEDKNNPVLWKGEHWKWYLKSGLY